MDHSPPGSSVHGISQARILKWVAMPSSRGSSLPRHQTRVSVSLALQVGFLTTRATWEAWNSEQSPSKWGNLGSQGKVASPPFVWAPQDKAMDPLGWDFQGARLRLSSQIWGAPSSPGTYRGSSSWPPRASPPAEPGPARPAARPPCLSAGVAAAGAPVLRMRTGQWGSSASDPTGTSLCPGSSRREDERVCVCACAHVCVCVCMHVCVCMYVLREGDLFSGQETRLSHVISGSALSITRRPLKPPSLTWGSPQKHPSCSPPWIPRFYQMLHVFQVSKPRTSPSLLSFLHAPDSLHTVLGGSFLFTPRPPTASSPEPLLKTPPPPASIGHSFPSPPSSPLTPPTGDRQTTNPPCTVLLERVLLGPSVLLRSSPQACFSIQTSLTSGGF